MNAEGDVVGRGGVLGGLEVHLPTARRPSVASNSWIRSPDGTTSTPNDSHQLDGAGVDAAMYGLAFRGAYSIATRFAPLTSVADAGLELLPAR